MSGTFDGFWVDVVRAKADELGANAISVTWPTLDGEVTVEYRRDDWLKVVYATAEPKTYVLAPDWTTAS